MPLPIVQYNDPVLRKKGEKVVTFDAELARFKEELVKAMHEAGGIGLAAQQVGRAVQVCVVDLRETEAEFDWTLDGAHPPLDLIMPMTLVNPLLVIRRNAAETTYEEGCLSFPGIRGEVSRPDQIDVSFQDECGVPHTLHCDGLFSRCIQHEADHLNGKLFIERMDKKVRLALDPEIRELSKRTKAGAGAAPAPATPVPVPEASGRRVAPKAATEAGPVGTGARVAKPRGSRAPQP